MCSKALRIIVFLLIICLNTAYSLASEKGTIRGMLIDSETLTAVPFATVELLGSIDSNLVKATISEISDNTPTNYINEIKLSPEIKQLDEAVVVGVQFLNAVAQ